MADECYENLCRTGQIYWKKHELMRTEFQDANSEDCFRYEEHIKKCGICQKALGIDKDFFEVGKL